MFAAAVICAAFAQLPPLTAKTADEYLTQLQSEESDYFARLETIAKAFVGVPFAKDPLGEGPVAPYDRDPLIDLSRVDGFSYVYQCLALAGSSTLEEATAAMNAIRYLGAEVDFLHRNHFFVEDWAVNNAFVTNITPELDFDTRGLMRFGQKAEFYKETPMSVLFEGFRPVGVTIYYMSRHDMLRSMPKFPTNSLLAFIGRNSQYFAENCGLYFSDGDDTPGLVYYASPEQGRVVAEPFAEVMEKSEAYVGVLVYSLHPERMSFVEPPAEQPDGTAPTDEVNESAAN